MRLAVLSPISTIKTSSLTMELSCQFISTFQFMKHIAKQLWFCVFLQRAEKTLYICCSCLLPSVAERNHEVDQMSPLSSLILKSKFLLTLLKYMAQPSENVAKKEHTGKEYFLPPLQMFSSHFQQKSLTCWPLWLYIHLENLRELSTVPFLLNDV